ncbi:CusA/CzcA family heavy metal efflux RND transporter [uncultured Imperialibacter sp.]|uniref:CusA/CzcA family heavy metal efflux RND transporter n=3 Tax=Imperialibacter TaxID=1649461 RepID=UPI0030DCC5F4|tara:strand:+ start:1111 stop:5532 length:4422 start_codon:yes stop_codon:yes gene_type:complete
MINQIISFSIKNKFIVGLLTLTLIGVGIYSMSTINLGSVPDITNNQVQVITVSENLATEDIEQFVTYPVELAMGNLPGVDEIRSISRFGLSVVTIVFEDDMGTYLPRQLVQEKLNELKETIPQEFGSPSMGPISTGLGQIYEYTIQPKAGYDTAYSAMELRTIQDWIVKRQLTLLEGVVEINSFGGYIKQYEVAINPEKLNALNVSISEVYEALARNNVNTGGAYIEKSKMANFIRGEGLVRTIDDIENISVRNENGIPILIRDVAEKVHFGHQVRYGAFTQDGHEAVGGIIMMLKGSNPNAVIQNVIQRMTEIEKSLPEGLEFNAYLDRSSLIERTTSTVSKNLIEGALIVIFVLVVLLGSLRGGIVTASLIPLSLLFAFILMKATGVWANLMSLGAIDFGIIVDGAVIIVEGTVHEIEKGIRAGKNKFDQAQMDEIAYESGSTMMNAAFFGQLIILIVFTPILFLTGVEGKMFTPMAYTFGYAVLGAIILCLTYVPMMTALLMRPISNPKNWFARLENGINKFSEKIINALNKVYHPLIIGALKLRLAVIGIALALLVGAGLIFSRMGGEFIPQLDEGDIAMQALIRPGSGLSEAIDVSIKIENILKENFPEITTAVARIGVADIPTDPMPLDIADMYLILEKDREKWVSADSKEQLIEKIKEKLDILPGVNLVFTQPVELRFNELLEGVREDVAVKLYGEDLSVLTQKVQEMAAIIQTVPGAGDVNAERTAGLPQMTVRYDRKKLAQYGLDVQKLNEYVSGAFAGGVAGVIFEGEKRFEMVIRFDESHRQSIEDLRTLYVDLPDGTQVPIKEVADIEYVPGPMQISRDNTFRRTYVGVNVRGRDVESVVTDIQQKLDAELDLPPGYYITYGGEFENLQRAKARLLVVVPIALFLIFILLYFALKSFPQSVMIYMAIPLAAIGGVFFMAVRGMPFSISAGVGFIVLFGVAVLNGLVLISRFNSLKTEGMTDIKERIITGTQERLRPILLTATAAIMGFTPMAFSASAGAEVQRPLATVVIGGLISATLLTLIVLPVLYSYIEGRKSIKVNLNTGSAANAIMALIVCGLLLGIPSKARAQELEQKSITTLDEAITLGLANNGNVQVAITNIELQEQGRKTAFNLGKTSVGVQYGQYNSFENDFSISVGQSFEFPTVYAKQKQLANEQVVGGQKQLAVTENDLKWKIRQAWYELSFLHERRNLLLYQDTVYGRFLNAATIRYETEATSYLEKAAAETGVMEVQNQLKLLEADIVIQEKQLQILLNDTSSLRFEPSDLIERDVINIQDNALIMNNPLLGLTKQQVAIADAEKSVQSARLMPDLFVGYFNQSLIGGETENGGIATSSDRFGGIQGGISIPLFYGSYKASVKSAQLRSQMANTHSEYYFTALQGQYRQQMEEITKFQGSLDYYKQKAIPQANLILNNARKSFENGAIDYVEYFQNINQALSIKFNYINTLNGYNQAVINLEFLIGQ